MIQKQNFNHIEWDDYDIVKTGTDKNTGNIFVELRLKTNRMEVYEDDRSNTETD